MTEMAFTIRTDHVEIRRWAIERAQRECSGDAVNSFTRTLQIADAFATYILTGAVPQSDTQFHPDNVSKPANAVNGNDGLNLLAMGGNKSVATDTRAELQGAAYKDMT